MADQPSLFDAEPVPRTRTGTHLEHTGADAAGPQLEVCDGCRADASWNPGRFCPTPAAHTWTGDAPEEGDMDARLVEEIVKRVDMVIALQGEEVDGAAAEETCRRLLETETFAEYPQKQGERVEYAERLATAVMAELAGGARAELPKTGPRVEQEGWDVETEGAPIIKTPIG